MSATFSSLLFVSSLLLSSVVCLAEIRPTVPIAKGLKWNFYKSTCPNLESIVRAELKKIFDDDIGQAAGLLRLHFHDCFVQGCDGSVLLDGSSCGPTDTEQDAPPNLSLRASAFVIINELREIVHKKCGRVVSCSDIVALAARDSIALSGGPDYEVPLGRRDGLTFATRQVTTANLPQPFNNASFLLANLSSKGFDATDVVALSGGHTIGRSNCRAFTPRLYPTEDPTMNEDFAADLKAICPTLTFNSTTHLDVRTPNLFDNKYFVNLVNREGLFTSDQDLYSYKKTRGIVTSFAEDQDLFFEKLVDSMTKMGQLSVLTGRMGEIRANCSVRNSDNAYLVIDETIVEEEDLETYAEL